MKKILLLLILVTQISIAQKNDSFSATYTYVNLGLDEIGTLKLNIRNSESLSIFQMNDQNKKDEFENEEGFNIEINGNDKIGKRVYKNLADKKIIFRDVYSKDGNLKPCIVSENLPNFIWVLGVKEKKIGTYICKSAELNFRGRDYIAWYTPKIPTSHGPWKFYGLPGMILEIKSKDGNISFTLNKIEESYFKESEIKKPNDGDKITFDEYVVSKKESVNEFLKKLMVKLPRGAKITMNSEPKNFNIETNFDN
jgi:GLPGLI family protein